MSLNRVILIGRLTKDPELRYTPNGHPVATFTLAVDREFKAEGQAKADTDFVNIVVWRKLAEVVAQHLGKGRLAAVDGRLQIRSYETQDGQKRWATEVVAERVQFLDRPKEQKQQVQQGQQAQQDDVGEEVPAGEAHLPF